MKKILTFLVALATTFLLAGGTLTQFGDVKPEVATYTTPTGSLATDVLYNPNNLNQWIDGSGRVYTVTNTLEGVPITNSYQLVSPTGTVKYLSSDSNSWITVVNGTGTLYRASWQNVTTVVKDGQYVEGIGYQQDLIMIDNGGGGPPIGEIFAVQGETGSVGDRTFNWENAYLIESGVGAFSVYNYAVAIEIPYGSDFCPVTTDAGWILDWVSGEKTELKFVTNSYVIATSEDCEIISNEITDIDILIQRYQQYDSWTIVPTVESAFVFDGAGTIMSYDLNLGGANVVIPYEINGIPVTAIGGFAFSDSYTDEGDPITSVIAPKSVTSIGSRAFSDCGNLTSVSLPSATSIGGNAFFDCGKLTSVDLPLVTSMGDACFNSCASLTSVSFPSATSISDGAFYNCVKLTSVSFPSATSISDYAFANCQGLTSVSFPLVTSIGDNAFDNCQGLKSVSFPSVTSIGDYAFSYCVNLTSVSFPLVTSIGDYAFVSCVNLTSVSFPLVTSISDSIFAGCGSLTSVSFPSATSIDGATFAGCGSLTSVFYGSNEPTSLEFIYESSPNVTNYVLTGTANWDATFPSTGGYQRPVVMVEDFGMVTNNVFANSVKADSIDTKTLLIDGVDVKNSIETLDLEAERLAQYGDASIVPTIESVFGFSNGTITSYDYDLGGANVVIPYEINGIPVTAIGGFAFSDGDTRIGDPITSVIAPKSATSIGGNAFEGCESLTSVSFPSVTSIGGGAFADCGSLTSVSFPSETSIGSGAFYNCVKLTSVSFPSVTSIGYSAFGGCVKLTSVFYGGNKPTTETNIYEDSSNVTNYVLTGTTNWDATFPSTGDYQRPVVMVEDFGMITNNVFAKTIKADSIDTKTILIDGVDIKNDYYPKSNPSNFVNSAYVASAIASNVVVDVDAIMMEQYGRIDITITNPDAFGFDGAGTITSYDFALGGAEVVIPYEINGIPVTAIGDASFLDTDEWMGHPITSFVAPKSVTSIGSSVFSDCVKLTSVSLPSATSIGDNAFYDCYSLASISLPLVTTIGSSAFSDCNSLASISLPSVTSIGNNAFNYCGNLTSVFCGGNKPTSTVLIYDNAPVTTYVLTGTTGWSSRFPDDEMYGNPVVMVDDFDMITNNVFSSSITVKNSINIGPKINGKYGQLYSNGTNLWFKNVNSVITPLTTN